MSPRNQDTTNCKSDHFLGESDDSLNIDFTPNILHKKHKVIKLVKAQLLNLQEDGLLDSINSTTTDNDYGLNQGVDFTLDVSNDETTAERIAYRNAPPSFAETRSNTPGPSEPTSPLVWLVWLILFLTAMFLTLFLAAWLSAGPLSNRAPHTPIPWSSLVQTDGIRELERKYLLRWSASNYLE